jgi:phospholipid/cholesterol/gamma-HCH transport system ATP-binding protein
MTEPIIEFKNVKKSFDDNVILEDLSFKVYPGETFCIVGGSGTGKSVSLKLLLGLLPIDSGEIFYQGRLISDLSENELNQMRHEFGMVFQGSALFDSLTIHDNVAYPLKEFTDADEEEIDTKVKEMLHVVGLPGVEDLYPADLSGGMRKRIGLARALVGHPKVILYDEPTAGLDPANVNRIDQLIMHLQKKYQVTSILVTHNMTSVFTVADRITLLYDKHAAFQGSLHDFKSSTNSLVSGFIKGEVGDE